MGSSQKNIYAGRTRRGRGFYMMGAHPLWVPASALYHVMEPPYVLGCFCVIYGYVKAWLQGEERRVDGELLRFIRNRQMKTLTGFWRIGKPVVEIEQLQITQSQPPDCSEQNGKRALSSQREATRTRGALPLEKYVVITPARDEARFIQQTIDSIVSQTVRPEEWVIVDDGSVDETAALALAASTRHPWIKVISLPNRGFRQVGAGTVEAFNAGLQALSTRDYKFLSCVDADIILKPRYFESLLHKFAADPQLGNACGQIYENVRGRLVELREGKEMTYGAIKCWRRECFADIGGLISDASWDAIDCYEAIRLGWRTAKFNDEELRVMHLRQIGSSDKNIFKGWFRRGHSLHFLGAHPLWILASIAFHLASRPFMWGGLCMGAGYVEALLKNRPRYDRPEFIQYLRHWQLRKITARIGFK
jgi:glycosyltransferase involved in cell wall biosynthesis